MAPIDLPDAGLPPKLPFVKNAVSAKHNKVKRNEMKSACISRRKNLFPHIPVLGRPIPSVAAIIVKYHAQIF